MTRTRFISDNLPKQVTDSVKKLGSQRVNNIDDDTDGNLVQFNVYLLTYRINNTSACYKATGIRHDDDDDNSSSSTTTTTTTTKLN